jgi:low temperature requirement protein LtrA
MLANRLSLALNVIICIILSAAISKALEIIGFTFSTSHCLNQLHRHVILNNKHSNEW